MLIYAPVKLKLKRKNSVGPDVSAAVATGFFWEHDGVFYLITNWHNVTGWDPVSNKCISRSGVEPTHVEMPLLLKVEDVSEREMLRRWRHDIPLYDADHKPLWLEHPQHGSKADVIAIEIAEMDDALASRPVNKIPTLVDFDPVIGNDVFVLGYPGGLDGGNELAIWKRGSIASPPSEPIDGLPKLLIDTATREGMSGAPTIVRQQGLVVPRGAEAKKGALSGKEIIGTAYNFLGIYSGRIGNDALGVQLGVVWKALVIDEILAGGKRGKSPY